MSHFFLTVIVPSNTENINAEVERLLAPFDENTAVDEYDEKCSCVGMKAYVEAQAIAWPNIDKIKKDFHARHQNTTDEEKDKLWRDEEYLPRDKKQKELIAAHALKDTPNPECGMCNGTGLHKTTYNPKSKWDWWRIGGRWDGEVQSREPSSSDGGFNFGDKHETVEGNVAKIEDAIKNKVTSFAILTPEGEWIERGAMGWWGVVKDEKDQNDWEDQVLKIFAKYEGHLVVGVDCHI